MIFKQNITFVTYYSFAVFTLFLIISCAQVGTLTGGAKDTTPPKILKSAPGNFSTDFSGKSITLVFDEFVQVKDLNNQLIISPPLEHKPELKIKGKSVIMEFGEKLKDSTTYTFNFGNALIDLNEGNPLDSNVFVFSTGHFLDSLSVSGTVKDVNAKPEKGVAVMLYANADDSIPYKEPPFYITRTKENGSYALKNIKAGNYKIFALKDINNNLLYDQPEELIGFSDSIIHLDTSAIKDLLLFEEEQQKQYVKKAYSDQYGKITFEFNLPVDSISVTLLNQSFKKPWFIKESSLNKDTINYWLTDIEGLDSLTLIVNDFKTIHDTFEIAIGKKEVINKGLKKGKTKAVASFKLQTIFNAGIKHPLDLNRNLAITFSHPIGHHDFSRVKLIRGKDTLTSKIETSDPALRIFDLVYPWEEDSLYKIFIPEGAFVDIFNLKNDTASTTFKVRTADSYGTIALKLNIPEKQHQLILELSKNKQFPFRSRIINHNETVHFPYLSPGDYYLKIVYDENNNGKWDTGNYLNKKQPEKIVFYATAITVRSNWDMELEWNIEGEDTDRRKN